MDLGKEGDILLMDYSPTEEEPTRHCHCDVCDYPRDKVVYFTSWKTPGMEYDEVRICQECLQKGLDLLTK